MFKEIENSYDLDNKIKSFIQKNLLKMNEGQFKKLEHEICEFFKDAIMKLNNSKINSKINMKDCIGKGLQKVCL